MESLFSNRMLHAVEMALRHQVDVTQLCFTQFYGGYLIGFPNYVALSDPELASAIRKGLLSVTYAQIADDVLSRLNEVREGRQFNDGIRAGMDDGTRFFVAVEEGDNPYGEDTSIALQNALAEGKIDFGTML